MEENPLEPTCWLQFPCRSYEKWILKKMQLGQKGGIWREQRMSSTDSLTQVKCSFKNNIHPFFILRDLNIPPFLSERVIFFTARLEESRGCLRALLQIASVISILEIKLQGKQAFAKNKTKHHKPDGKKTSTLPGSTSHTLTHTYKTGGGWWGIFHCIKDPDLCLRH